MTTRFAGAGLGGALGGGGIGNANRFRTRSLAPEYDYRAGRSHEADAMYDAALNDPAAQAEKFQGFYQQAADAYTAQAGRDFQQNIGTVAGNIGRRFGGNASSYEQAQVTNAGNAFAQRTNEALAGLAPQAAAQGLQYTGMLGQRSNDAAGRQDLQTQILMQALGQQRQNEKDEKKGGLLGGLVGTLGGLASLGLPGGGTLGGKFLDKIF